MKGVGGVLVRGILDVVEDHSISLQTVRRVGGIAARDDHAPSERQLSAVTASDRHGSRDRHVRFGFAEPGRLDRFDRAVEHVEKARQEVSAQPGLLLGRLGADDQATDQPAQMRVRDLRAGDVFVAVLINERDRAPQRSRGAIVAVPGTRTREGRVGEGGECGSGQQPCGTADNQRLAAASGLASARSA